MNLKRKKAKKYFSAAFRWFFLISLSYIVFFQFFYMISYAFRPVSDQYNPNVIWVPSVFTFDNIIDAFKTLDYPISFLYSVEIGQVSAIIEVIVCAVIAYGFARFDFPEKKIVFALVIITIIIPSQMILMPSYINYSNFDFFGILKLLSKATGRDMTINLIDTNLTFYLPSIFGVGVRSGLFIYIYRKFFENLPKELEEAAYVDGAGPLKTFVSVILPSSGVVLVTVFLFSVIWHWNESYLSGVYFVDRQPLAVKLSSLTTNLVNAGQSDSRNLRMAACLIFILPMLVLYGFMQKRFIQSIDRVGIVG